MHGKNEIIFLIFGPGAAVHGSLLGMDPLPSASLGPERTGVGGSSSSGAVRSSAAGPLRGSSAAGPSSGEDVFARFFARDKRVGHSDLSQISDLSHEKLLDCLRKRFCEELVYTFIGDIVTSVNPFKQSVGDELKHTQVIRQYLNENVPLHTPSRLPPHIYSLVGKTRKRMGEANDGKGRSQSILISGESGAGKTEAMKIALGYLSELAAHGVGSAPVSDVGRRVLHTNPVMESIGNATTVRNNNSSRFGKHIDIQFSSDGRILGAMTTHYLLEKPRICKHEPGERNYHVFYMLCAAPEESRKPYHISADWREYTILGQPGTLARVQTWDDAVEFRSMQAALEGLHLQAHDLTILYGLIAAVLHLGNLTFEPWEWADGTGARVAARGDLDRVASMLQVEPEALEATMCAKMLEIRGERTPKRHNKAQASVARNSLCMHLYALAFDWCVERINSELAAPAVSVGHCIGVLDIFGFENFGAGKNSLPQLCINLTNERLHSLFIEHIFKLEQELYVKEDVEWQFVDIETNQPVSCCPCARARPALRGRPWASARLTPPCCAAALGHPHDLRMICT